LATYQAITEWAETLTDGTLECRGTGSHAWTGRTQEYQRGYGYYRITWECANCECTRTAEIDAAGAIMGHPWIDYPTDHPYLSPLGRITGSSRDAVRNVMIRRATTRFATTERPPRYKGTYQRVTPNSRKRRA